MKRELNKDKFGSYEIIKSNENVANMNACFILAVKNSLDDLRASVSSILNQSNKDFELIIVNDGSDQEGFDDYINDLIEKDKRVICLKQKNIGLTKSLIRALNETSAEYILRQDADDLSSPIRLEEQLKYKSYDVVFSRAIQKSKEIERIVPRKDVLNHISYNLLRFGNRFIHGTLFCKRSVLQRINYDESVKYAQDYDLFLRFLKDEKLKIGIIEKPLYTINMSETQISTSRKSEQDDYASNSCKSHFGSDSLLIANKKNVYKRFLQVYAELYKYLPNRKIEVLK